MFNRVVLDQNIFIANKPSALPTILMVNTFLALIAGVIFWAVLERSYELESQLFAEEMNQPLQTISSVAQQPDSEQVVMTATSPDY